MASHGLIKRSDSGPHLHGAGRFHFLLPIVLLTVSCSFSATLYTLAKSRLIRRCAFSGFSVSTLIVTRKATMTTPTYFRPVNADTGQLTLATYFTAPLCRLVDAHRFDLEDRIKELAGDVRDHLDQLGVPIRPTIAQGRVRIVQEVNEGEEFANPPEVTATVMAFLTDAEPGDPRLAALESGFHSEALNADVTFSIPTTESEAELERSIAADKARGAAYIAREKERQSAPAAGPATTPAGVSEDILDDMFG